MIYGQIVHYECYMHNAWAGMDTQVGSKPCTTGVTLIMYGQVVDVRQVTDSTLGMLQT